MNKRSADDKKELASEFVRTVIWRRGLKAAAVSKVAGVEPGSLSRFLARKRNLSGDGLDKVAEALGLELVETKGGLR